MLRFGVFVVISQYSNIPRGVGFDLTPSQAKFLMIFLVFRQMHSCDKDLCILTLQNTIQISHYFALFTFLLHDIRIPAFVSKYSFDIGVWCWCNMYISNYHYRIFDNMWSGESYGWLLLSYRGQMIVYWTLMQKEVTTILWIIHTLKPGDNGEQ